MTSEISHGVIGQHARQAIDKDREALPFSSFSSFVPSNTLPRPLSIVFERLFIDDSLGVPLHHVAEANSYLESLIQPSADPITVTTPKQGNEYPTEACLDAEELFDFARRQLYEPLLGHQIHTALSVYHGYEGQPMFLRKNNVVSTALSLVALRMSGSNVMVPPGTIVSIGPLDQKDVTGTAYLKPLIRTHPTSKLRSIAFDPDKHPVLPLRLSAWAFPRAIDRALYAVGGRALQVDPLRVEVATKHSMEDYRQVAADLLKLCTGEDASQYAVPAVCSADVFEELEGVANYARR
jgi:hypothetical protein